MMADAHEPAGGRFATTYDSGGTLSVGHPVARVVDVGQPAARKVVGVGFPRLTMLSKP